MGNGNCCDKIKNIDKDFNEEKVFTTKRKDKSDKDLKMNIINNMISNTTKKILLENGESDSNNFNSNDIKLNIIYCNSFNSKNQSIDFKRNNRIIGDKKSNMYK